MNRIYKFPQDIQQNYFLRLYCFLFYVVDRMKSPCSVKHRSIAGCSHYLYCFLL